jgi:abortive infection bacteriophage resistance protein
LWNRELAVKPELPNAWKGAGLDNRRFYIIALVIHTLLSEMSPQTQWKERLKAHFNSYPSVDLAPMHFPANWQHQVPWM